MEDHQSHGRLHGHIREDARDHHLGFLVLAWVFGILRFRVLSLRMQWTSILHTAGVLQKQKQTGTERVFVDFFGQSPEVAMDPADGDCALGLHYLRVHNRNPKTGQRLRQ